METITYSLANKGENSAGFYQTLTSFTNQVLKKSQRDVDDILKHFARFVREYEIEFARSRDEYFIEFLALGVLWNCYSQQAMALTAFEYQILQKLYAWRRKNQRLKPKIDAVRGWLMSRWLTRKKTKIVVFSRANLSKLLCWLDAAGDFHEEAKRLANWQMFFSQLPEMTAAGYLRRAVEFADLFELDSRRALGQYTGEVERFLAAQPKRYHGKEDIIFTGRKRVEYHLNMVAAEILNRELQSDFRKSQRRIVLLPTCMRNKPEGECRAKRNGLDITCSGCSKECRVNQITRACKEMGAETRLIPHSSQFTTWLERYKGQKDVGLVGVACVLNLLTGGYEMKNLNLASQCVFLDFCGCQKHWHEQGIPTDLNLDQLKQVLRRETVAQRAWQQFSHLFAA